MLVAVMRHHAWVILGKRQTDRAFLLKQLGLHDYLHYLWLHICGR